MMMILFKYLFITIFVSSAIGKLVGFEETLIYFAGMTKISSPLLKSILWILISLEIFIPILVLINGIRLKAIYISIQFLLFTFLITNILFLIAGVENCGCFGASVQSHPTVGILKTIFLIIIMAYLHKGKFLPVWLNFRKMS